MTTLHFFLVISFLYTSVESFIIKNPCNRFTHKRLNAVDEEAKAALLSNTDLSRTDINELILKLEKTNPTEHPAQSSLVNGVWDLVVCGVGSPGLFGYQVIKSLVPGGGLEDIEVTISNAVPRVQSSVGIKFGSARVAVSVSADLDVLSGTRLREQVKTAKVDFFSVNVPEAINPPRELVVSYVDEDLLIVRDPLGAPELLKRKSKDFAPSTSKDSPSTTDDNGAPGA